MGSNDAQSMFGCFFDRETDVEVRPERQFSDGPWGELCEVLSRRDVRENKFGGREKNGGVELLAPMYNLAKFEGREGKEPRRSDGFVIAHSGIVFDLDEQVDIDTIHSQMRDVEFHAYTTHTHDPAHGLNKWRITVPLARPVPASAYKAARAWVVSCFPKAGLLVDKKAAALSTAYFLPSCPVAKVKYSEAFRNEGLLVELPRVTELRSPGSERPQARKITKTIDWPWAKARASAHPNVDLRNAFRAVFKGQPFGVVPTHGHPGSRNDTLSRMCGALAGWYPHASPDELASIFEESLRKMWDESPNDPPPDVAWAADNIERSQASLLAKAQSEEVEYTFAGGIGLGETPVKKERPDTGPIEATFTPAQAEALEIAATDEGLTTDQLRASLILRTGPSHWVWHPHEGTWVGPWQEREVYDVAHENIGNVAGVQLYRFTKDGGVVQKEKDLLCREYGKVLYDINYDLEIPRTRFDWATRTLSLAVERRRLVPEEAPPEVQAWIEALGGDYADKLLDWLATMLRFDVPTAALFIQGSKGSGKSLFARSLSQIWDVKGPTVIAQAAAHFNDELLRCPLVWIDEGKWDNFADPTLVLRRLITEPSRRVEEKYLSKIDLVGYIRVVASVNNFNIFAQKESLTPEDRDAIAERFLCLSPREDAGDILRAFGKHADKNALVDEQIIAKHILWLAENRHVEPASRFLVEGDTSGEFADRMITDDKGWGAWVTEWLAGWLANPLTVERENAEKVYRSEGRCIINPRLLVDRWGAHVKNAKPPHAQEISDALRSLSVGGKIVEFPEPNPTGMCGFEIKTEVIVAWAARTGHANVSAILKNSKGRAARPMAAVYPIREESSVV